jgi:CheY-like chemotaxis protein
VHVLIVDPHPDGREVIQMGYRSEHICWTTCAADADEATSAVQRDRPDAALVSADEDLASAEEVRRTERSC